MNPVISIIVPVYNVEKYLPQCVDSVLSQTYKDFELILVDDGSPDGSPAICDSYAQKDVRIRVIHQNNAGVSAARNNGIEQAAGEWITFIDSDDWVEPNYLSNFRLDESNSMDFIIQGIEYYDHRDGHFFNSWSFKDCVLEKHNFRLGFAENRLMEVGFPYGKVYRKKLLIDNDIRFDTRISFHEDHIFVLDYYKVCHLIRLVSATDYKYRCYHTSISLSSKRHPWAKMNLAADEMLSRIKATKGEFFEENDSPYRIMLNAFYKKKMVAAEAMILSEMSYFEKNMIFKNIINKDELRYCFSPKDRETQIRTFLYLHFPFLCIYFYHYIFEFVRKVKRLFSH